MSTLAKNKHVFSDYDILETFEGGLVLQGWETKSAKLGHVQLTGAFLHFKGGELWLRNGHIGYYAPAGNLPPGDGVLRRERKILIHKRELARLAGRVQADRLTLVPISLYTKKNLVKIEFALARGKRQYEKRADLKKRETDRHLREHMKEAQKRG